MTRSRADLHVPGQHPVVEVGLFVEEAGQDNEGRHGIQYREDADTNHKFLQFIGLGAIVFHNCTDSEERDKSGQQKHSAQDQVHEQGSQDEPSQRVNVPQTDVAYTAQDVTCNNKRTSCF